MRIWNAIMSSAGVAWAVLREIFDESAYERFLKRHNSSSTPVAYRDFLRESEASRARRPRCC